MLYDFFGVLRGGVGPFFRSFLLHYCTLSNECFIKKFFILGNKNSSTSDQNPYNHSENYKKQKNSYDLDQAYRCSFRGNLFINYAGVLVKSVLSTTGKLKIIPNKNSVN